MVDMRRTARCDTGAVNGMMIASYVVGYALLIGFFVLERFTRAAGTKDMARQETDRGSTTFVSVAMGVAFVLIPLSPLLNWWGPGFLRWWPIGILGAAMGIGGLVIRYHAFTTLGRFFTRTLQQTDQHALVTTGIYQHIRHPGYLSDILIFWGAGLAMNNGIVTAILVVLFVPAYLYRIRVEEQMLTDAFGEEYRAYQASSARLIPYIW